MTAPNNEKPSFIYVLFDVLTPTVIRYVGKTVAPQNRLSNHIWSAKQKGDKTYREAWVLGVLSSGSNIGMSIIAEYPTQLEAYEAEIGFISQYRELGYDLVNLCGGGIGSLGHSNVRTDSSKKLMSERMREHMASLTDDQKKERSDKRLATIRENNNGVFPGYSKGQSSPFKGKTWTPEMKAKASAKHKARWAAIKADKDRYEEVTGNISKGTKAAVDAKNK